MKTQALVNERAEGQAAATMWRAKALAIYETEDYTLEQAVQALEYIYQASKLERLLGLPPQTKHLKSIEQVKKMREITPEEKERCERARQEYERRQDEKAENRKAKAKKPEPCEGKGYKPMPAQITFGF